MAGEARQILAQNLRLLRFHRRWSQETLGFEAGLHRTYISQIEKGKSNVSIDNIAPQGHFLTLFTAKNSPTPSTSRTTTR